jgi:hypothetical protein
MTGRPALVTSYAACPDYSLAGPVTKGECQVALAACLAKGWLQVIDEAALARIADELREGRFLGPVYGLPEVGGVDFTGAGAELWHRYGRLCSAAGSRNSGPPFAFTDVVHCKYTRYFRTQVAALADIEDVRSYDDVVSVSGPTPTGPWRVQWWRRFPEGCRIDIEEQRQWQGRGFGEGQGHCLARSPRKDDAIRLRHILDCHNLTLLEWLLLAAMEGSEDYKSASYLPRRVAASAAEQVGVKVSEDECRTGLEACLRSGWLRVVDQLAVDEVHALVRDDPALPAVPGEVMSRRGEIDFTPCGATLYRMIAAEWLGPDWEDGLRVWKESYREEHRYCEGEEGLRNIVQELAGGGEVVRASKVVAIGPWCVRWWDRFPGGYRLELQVGEP